jgi:ParB family chromosome partitioning protein
MPRQTTEESSSRKRLGRGLGNLISAPLSIEVPIRSPESALSHDSGATSGQPNLRLIDVERITPNRRQPRQVIDDESLKSLAASIRAAGVIQPIVVRRSGQDAFELIAGERRWRAAKLAGLTTIPGMVRDVDDRTAAAAALVENLQREDLNTIDQAEAFRRLVQEFGLTHQQVADEVGMDRSTVSNLLRLNDLDDDCKAAVRGGLVTSGHARALLAITNVQRRTALLRQVVRQEWSVRDLENRIRAAAQAASREHGAAGGDAASTDHAGATSPHQTNINDLQSRLGEHLGTRVLIRAGRRKGSGRLIIEFYGFDHFDGLMERIGFARD